LFVGKVRNEISNEIDTAKIEPRLAELRETYRLMRDQLFTIVYWKEGDPPPKPLARDRVEAAKNVVMLDLAILQAEAAAGLYKRPIEEMVRTIHYEPVPPEIRAVIIAAWSRGGFELPKATAEGMISEGSGERDHATEGKGSETSEQVRSA
jgi:hypothetical protein